MHSTVPKRFVGAIAVWLAAAGSAGGQIVETVGSRALGMGGAFVGVANDSSATWWNPAGLAVGPFVDLALGRATTSLRGQAPGWRDRGLWFSAGTPPFGVSIYRLRVTDIGGVAPTAQDRANREAVPAGVLVRSWSAYQLGVTFVQTLLPGLHAGATVKYVRGTVRAAVEPGSLSPAALLDRGRGLEGGKAAGAFDLDVGLMAAFGAVRVGALMRNVSAADFKTGTGPALPAQEALRLPRQLRGGVTFDGEAAGMGPLTIALDADLRRYHAVAAERRIVAVGAERWLGGRRVGLRGGGRVNTLGGHEAALTVGLSVALRPGLYLDAHAAGGAAGEGGWGLAARVSF